MVGTSIGAPAAASRGVGPGGRGAPPGPRKKSSESAASVTFSGATGQAACCRQVRSVRHQARHGGSGDGRDSHQADRPHRRLHARSFMVNTGPRLHPAPRMAVQSAPPIRVDAVRDSPAHNPCTCDIAHCGFTTEPFREPGSNTSVALVVAAVLVHPVPLVGIDFLVTVSVFLPL